MSDITEVVRPEFDCNCSDVLFQTIQLRGAGNWNNPRLPGQQPRQRDLSRRRLLPFSNSVKITPIKSVSLAEHDNLLAKHATGGSAIRSLSLPAPNSPARH